MHKLPLGEEFVEVMKYSPLYLIQLVTFVVVIVFLQSSLYIFGGRNGQLATDELWSFDTRTLIWSLLPRKGTPLPVAGHTATLVDSTMIVLFGYGQRRNYTDKVQEFDLGNNYTMNEL